MQIKENLSLYFHSESDLFQNEVTTTKKLESEQDLLKVTQKNILQNSLKTGSNALNFVNKTQKKG